VVLVAVVLSVFVELSFPEHAVSIIVFEADQSGACLRAKRSANQRPFTARRFVSRKHEMWLARAQEHSEEEDRGGGMRTN
jgi:hypothetical protein